MKLYLISQEENNDYDTYDKAIVVAESEDEARRFHPSRYYQWDGEKWMGKHSAESYGSWASSPEKVQVKYIGETGLEQGVVLASYNAG